MATKPQVKKLTASSADILNAIKNNASTNYRDYVPDADPESLESIRDIGNVIMQYPALQNEFLSALVNRIGRVIITSKMYSNPLAMFKKGQLEFGETVEEIFANIAKPYEYDAEKAGDHEFKREIPDVRAAFHVLNYRKFYKATIEQEQLRQAFLSWDGVNDLISKIVDSMYTAAAYDEFLMCKYLVARKALNGQLYPVPVLAATTEADYKKNAATMRATSNKLTFMSDKYNLAGVATHTPIDDQYYLVNADYEGANSVEVLAYAFNMDKADVLGHVVMIDGFNDLDTDRLQKLFTDQDGNKIGDFKPFTEAEIKALNEVPAFLVDKDFFMIFDVLQQFTEKFIGEGLYWNYWYHTWKIISSSPYANAVVYVPGTPAVNSVTITPNAASITAGQSVQFNTVVDTTGFAPKSVKYTLSGDGAAKAKITPSGTLKTEDDATGTITVTATSTYDETKTAEATVTIQV